MYEGTEVNVGQAKQQTVLAVLLLNMNRPVPVETIIDAVWANNPPRDARNTVQTYVSRLRRVLQVGDGDRGPDTVVASTKCWLCAQRRPRQAGRDRVRSTFPGRTKPVTVGGSGRTPPNSWGRPWSCGAVTRSVDSRAH